MRPWLVCVLLAGCAGTPVTVDEVPDAGWQAGDWWQYNVTRDGDTASVTLVFDGARMLVSDPEVVKENTADGYGFSGTYDGHTRKGEVLVRSGSDPTYVDTDINWLPKNLTKGTTWDAGVASGRVLSNDGDAVRMEYLDLKGTWHGVYSKEAQWFSRIDWPTETWVLTAHGTNHTGPSWLVERTAAIVDVIGGQLWVHEIGPADDVRFTYDLQCASPGFAEFRLDGPAEPIQSYRDTCPASETRVLWFEPDSDAVRIDANTAHADPQEPIVVGYYYLDGVQTTPA